MQPGRRAPTARTPGYSEGEPHIQTLSGGSYEFQGAGEYTLVRSTSGEVDVQVRSVPAGNSKLAAWNVAVAMHVVSSTVEVDVGEPPVVRLDGKRIALSQSKARVLAGGGKLAYTSNGLTGDVVVTWPDGSQLDVFSDRLAENATFTPPPGGVDTFSGLLTAIARQTQHRRDEREDGEAGRRRRPHVHNRPVHAVRI